MKKRVASLEALQRAALTKGASVDFKGAQFNTTHERLQVLAKTPPVPQQKPKAPQPEPAKPMAMSVDVTPIAHAIERNNQMLTKEVAGAILQAATQAKPAPVGWTLKVNRNQWGQIETITATPNL